MTEPTPDLAEALALSLLTTLSEHKTATAFDTFEALVSVCASFIASTAVQDCIPSGDLFKLFATDLSQAVIASTKTARKLAEGRMQ